MRYRSIVGAIWLFGAVLAAPGAYGNSAQSKSIKSKGEQLYLEQGCYGCHGYQGVGRKNLAYGQSSIVKNKEAFLIYLRARTEIKPDLPSLAMPGYSKAVLSDADAVEIFNHIQTFPQTPIETATSDALQSILSQRGDSASRDPLAIQWLELGSADWETNSQAIKGHSSAGAGYLVSARKLANFELRIEFKTTPGTNSGIFLRCQSSELIDASTCYEANIWDDRPDQSGATGAIAGHSVVHTELRTAGSWNTAFVKADEKQIVFHINGIETASIANVARDSGYLALQVANGDIEFRNIRLNSL